MVVALLGLTMFVSAFLLFWCQPMVAKMVLPFLGGSASVWTTCVLFFQVVLVAGYVYSHVLATNLRLKTQLLVHIAVVLTAVMFLPLRFVGTPDGAAMEHPTVWLLLRLIATIGVPFFVISTTAPLLQNWLAQTNLDKRRNPYFLYAASNVGSLLSLLMYPVLIEPRAGLSMQSGLWSAGYGLFVCMVVTGALIVRKHAVKDTAQEPSAGGESPPVRMRLYWLAAAFVPSALMLAVTNHISVNLASAPFLWIAPLALYLLTFILVFAKTAARSQTELINLSRWSPLALLLFLPIIPDVSPPGPALNWMLMLGHLMVLFVAAYLCHTALAARRPDPRHLTEFYFWLALGGAMGGVFAAVVAPAVFDTILEYPLLVALLPFFRQSRAGSDRFGANWKDWALPGALALAFTANWYTQRMTGMQSSTSYAVLLPDAVFFVAVFFFRAQRLRFALGYAVLLCGYALTMPALIEDAERIYVTRNFFGVKKVLFDVNSNVRKLLHGDTLHGIESQDPVRSGVALSYYHESGPAGDVMRVIAPREEQKVAVVGLGSGSMAAYGGPTRHITFLDVDSQVAKIASSFFTFLRRCGENCTIVIADGRLGMEHMRDGEFDVIMLDAFSSDSIPAHLASREAMRVYLAKLKPDGMLLFHVSNRYLKVDRLVGAAVADAGMVGLLRSDREEQVKGKSGSDYVVAARRIEDLGQIALNHGWQRIQPDPDIEPWTDDYSNILRLVKWR